MNDDYELSETRHMCSEQITELNGVNANAVSARVALLDDPAHRSLIWWLQAQSFSAGGLKRLAREILAEHPDRIGTPSMHRFGTNPNQIYNAKQVRAVRGELPQEESQRFPLRGEFWDICDGGYCALDSQTDYYNLGPRGSDRDQAYSHPTSYPAARFVELCQCEMKGLPRFLKELCINPTLRLSREPDELLDFRLRDLFPCENPRAERAGLWWFQDIVGALVEQKRRQEEAVRAEFVLTQIGKKVWDTLDFALKTGRMVFVQGWEGRGKSEAARAWFRCHQGEARLVELSGITNKTSIVQAIAKGVRIGSSLAQNPSQALIRIEDVLHRSGLMLIIDEAHFLLPQGKTIRARPELLDWLDTALCNHDVPVGLISTPQFVNGLQRVQDQVGYNWRQFRRRVRRWVKLPDSNTDEDLRAVAKRIMPGLCRAGITYAVGYAKLSLRGAPSRDISGLGDVAVEARILAEEAGRSEITFDDVQTAIDDHLTPSDEAFAAAMAAPTPTRRRRPADQQQTHAGDVAEGLQTDSDTPTAPVGDGEETNFAGCRSARTQIPERNRMGITPSLQEA
jgi:hypothetical protein